MPWDTGARIIPALVPEIAVNARNCDCTVAAAAAAARPATIRACVLIAAFVCVADYESWRHSLHEGIQGPGIGEISAEGLEACTIPYAHVLWRALHEKTYQLLFKTCLLRAREHRPLNVKRRTTCIFSWITRTVVAKRRVLSHKLQKSFEFFLQSLNLYVSDTFTFVRGGCKIANDNWSTN